MRQSIHTTSLLILVGLALCMAQENFLQYSRISDLFSCVKNLKKSANLLPQVSAAIKLKLYNKAIEDLKLLLTDVNTAIEKCAEGTCWMEGQQRCENDIDGECEKWGLLWYPVCKAGYHNNACCICSQDCPSGFRDDGLECGKPSAYGRGVGYPWKFGDAMNLDKARERCERDNSALGCEKYGAIIYPKCRAGFHNVGCCVCSPDCEDGMTDIGVSCQKKTYGRGVGYTEGKCIEEDWSDYTPIQKYGKCLDQVEQIAIDTELVVEALQDNAKKWVTIKRAYVLLQHAGPFLTHCSDIVTSLINH